MPEAPAPIPDLSRTMTSRPAPRPELRNIALKCQAVLRPWMPAPMTTYFACEGSVIVRSSFQPPTAADHARTRGGTLLRGRELRLWSIARALPAACAHGGHMRRRPSRARAPRAPAAGREGLLRQMALFACA